MLSRISLVTVCWPAILCDNGLQVILLQRRKCFGSKYKAYNVIAQVLFLKFLLNANIFGWKMQLWGRQSSETCVINCPLKILKKYEVGSKYHFLKNIVFLTARNATWRVTAIIELIINNLIYICKLITNLSIPVNFFIHYKRFMFINPLFCYKLNVKGR